MSSRQRYGPGSSPTERQIIDAVIECNGSCTRIFDYCISNVNRWGYSSNRVGDTCPLYDPDGSCTSHDRVKRARKWLMETD